MADEVAHLPLIPLRDVVVFPYMVIPLFVGREDSIRALEVAMEQDKQVIVSAQKDAKVDDPKAKDVYNIGCVATVLQMLRLPDGTVKVLIEGSERVKILKQKRVDGYMRAEYSALATPAKNKITPEVKALMRSLLAEFEKLIKSNKKIPAEVLAALRNIEDPVRLGDNIAAHLTVKVEVRQRLLAMRDVVKRLNLLMRVLTQELELIEVEKKIQGRVKEQVEESQRKYYLSEKIKAIQRELGELDDKNVLDENEELEQKIKKAGMPEDVQTKAYNELNKLKMMPPMSAEATVSRNYLEWLLDVPWKERSPVSKDLKKAAKILETDHYGLERIKERILEYLAVQQRVDKLKGPILCLVGPPGVGKTSLGQSIANATGRKFVRISLGGVRDEAEIRGHRRTYIGALPGKIIQKMAKVKVRNPLFMLDEVDKMAMDFRGDPASALLEVLDPEQNHTFNDHYLEVDYDLSDVMFIATANSMNIPGPLLDRMEVIRIAGYTEDEKLNIAMRYLIPRQVKQNGLKPEEINISEGAVREIIRYYTREAGVRNLEREIAGICRKVVKEIMTAKRKKIIHITARNIEKYLGVHKYRFGLAEADDRIGHVTGLAWTEVGGDLLTLEAQVVPGKGKSLSTGHLGEVMQESIQAAMTVVRSRAGVFGIADEYFQKHDFHIHVPEGATPKDGPSAGIGMCTAIVSAITRIPVRADVAMTGEITLRGEVLPIGGLKEKLLAALRGGIKLVLIPAENKRDLKEIPKNVLEGLEVKAVRWIDEVLDIALRGMPEALTKSRAKFTEPLKKRGRRGAASEGRNQTH